MTERTHETLTAAIIALVAEAVAVTLFMAMIFVWVAVYATRGMQ